MKKKIVALTMCVAMLALAVVGGTLAYFTDEKEATNTFTVGNVEIELTEPAWTTTGSEDAPEVYPGEALAKDPTVTNTGDNPCLVRIKVTGLDCLNAAGAGNIKYRTNYAVDTLGADWVDGKDGYFYYTKALAVNDKTTPVFDSIVIPTDLENLEENVTNSFNVNVYAEAVQAQGVFPSYSAVEDGISETELSTVIAFFNTAFAEETPAA